MPYVVSHLCVLQMIVLHLYTINLTYIFTCSWITLFTFYFFYAPHYRLRQFNIFNYFWSFKKIFSLFDVNGVDYWCFTHSCKENYFIFFFHHEEMCTQYNVYISVLLTKTIISLCFFRFFSRYFSIVVFFQILLFSLLWSHRQVV